MKVDFFSGEIFNMEELGCPGATPEGIVLNLYERGGIDAFAKIRGAFAFVLSDETITLLVRDQFGSVPVYYAATGSSPLYGTSVCGLLAKGVPRKLSRAGLISYLSYGCLYAPYTMVDGVYIVPPGCAAIIRNGDVSVRRYWKPPFDVGSWRVEDAQEAVDCELKRAVREQTRIGNPAAFLSGGVDSSSIVALWRKQFDGEIRTYCVTHEDERTDERRWARMVAERNGTKHTELLLEDRMVRRWLDEAVSSYDQPSLDGLNFWFASKLLKELTDEKLMLSGEGGDELFMGYGQFAKHRLAYKYAPLMRLMPRVMGRFIDAVTKGWSRSEKYRKLAMLAGFKGEPYFVPRRILSDWQIRKLLRPGLSPRETCLDSPDNEWCVEELPDDQLNRISWLEMQTVVSDMWMRDGFQTCGHNGISLRTPLCDIKLAERLYTIPGEMKCDDRITKPLLVSAAGTGLPEACVTRRKQGFSLPFDRFFSGDVKDRIDEFLSGERVRLFDPGVIRTMGRRYREGKLYWNRIWELFMVENWCRQNKVEL